MRVLNSVELCYVGIEMSNAGLQSAVAEIERYYADRVKSIALFGSRARLRPRVDADWDLLLVLARGERLCRDLYREWDESVAPHLQALLPGIEPHFVHLPDHDDEPTSLWLEVATASEILMDRAGVLAACLGRVRDMIDAGTLERRNRPGTPLLAEHVVTNPKLELDYVTRAGHRLEALQVLLVRGSHADAVLKAQEIVELCLKALLRASGVTVPRIHDVGHIILSETDRLPPTVRPDAERMAAISKAMRKDREIAFYGAEDLVPSEFYTHDDAERAFEEARWIYERAASVVRPEG